MTPDRSGELARRDPRAMSIAEARAAVCELLRRVAPEADPASLDDTSDLRRELDLDSIDYQNFLIALHRHFGVEIPQREVGRFSTLEGCLAFLRGEPHSPPR